MSNEQFSADQMRAMARQHLQSLRLAGVEWLPFEPYAMSPPPAAATADEPVDDSSLLETKPASEPALPIEQRRKELEVLAKQVSQCMACPELVTSRTQTVFADGSPGVDLCFVGEGPGFDEDRQGIPFVGAAGQLLNKIIAACGLKREEVYICNIVKCRPPGNRTPLPNEAANCRSFLERQLELVQPKFICALGACAAQNLLSTTVSIGGLRGKFRDYRGIPVMCTYHPAYLLRNPEKKREVWKDMKMLLRRMGRPIPST